MAEALEVLVGPEAKGLSPAVISKLKRQWSQEYQSWRARRLDTRRWVYWWADGIYSGLRGDSQRLCALVIVGVDRLDPLPRAAPLGLCHCHELTASLGNSQRPMSYGAITQS